MADEDFAAFFRREYPGLVVHLGLRGYPRVAEDAAEEAMRDAYEKWHDIDKPAAWVRTAALRHAMRITQRERRGEAREDAYVRAAMAAQVDDPQGWAELSEERRAVFERIMTMPPERRQVVALAFDGYGIGEIARILGKAEATVRSHLRYARRELSDFGPKGGTS